MNRVLDQVALVTGSAQGIGAAYAIALAKEGARVLVADVVNPEATARRIRDGGGTALAMEVDVTDPVAVDSMVRRAEAELGTISILVNNAAVFGALELKPMSEIEVSEWDQVMAVNVKGPFLCSRAVLPGMHAKKYGRIVNVASGTVFKGTPGMLHYVASKGAIVAFTRALAREVGDSGICVNTLAPGLVLSESVVANQAMREKLSPAVLASRAIKRDQTPDDLIAPLLFLCSDDCRFMTGQVVVVDGGSVMH